MKTSSNVMIFGASGVIGGAIATVFGQQGWTVGLHYHHHRSVVMELATTIQHAGGNGFVYQADVAEPSQICDIVQAFIQSHGALHVLIWAVGVGPSGLVIKTSPENWTRTLQVNLTGAFHVLHAIAPIFAQQKDGAVILIGSLSGERGLAGQAAYAASKAGLIGLMRTAAQEWGALNIRVNVIFPGWHVSPLSKPGWDSAMKPDTHTLLRTPSLKSMALSVYHLSLSPDISGQVWNLDSRMW
jgi:3-oxoacyl-[acyl-carrier protein] reductase